MKKFTAFLPGILALIQASAELFYGDPAAELRDFYRKSIVS